MISIFTAEEQGDTKCYLYAIQNAVPAKRLRNGWMRVAQNIHCVILRRPILVAEDKILVGAKEKEWEEYLMP